MASKNSRYELRSSQRDSQDYDTPRMEGFGSSDNARLSQSDIYRFDSQMENFLSDSFGSRFNNMNSMSEFDIRSNLYNTPKTEADPSLNALNYLPSQERGTFHHQDHQNQFIPLNDDNNVDYPLQPPTYLEDDYGGYVYSQGNNGQSDLNQEYRFMCTVMPQAKNTNREYLPRKDLLFAKFQSYIPFNFMITNPVDQTSIQMPIDMSIRMSLRFAAPVSDDKVKVYRCHVHAEKDHNGAHKTMPFTVNHREAVYDDANLCVTIPASTVCSLAFQCYSSCAGGIDRKPVFVLFELLNGDGSVAQTVELPVKVSANPSRDAPKEEERKRKEEEKSGRGRVKSEASSEMDEKRGRKRKTEDKEEMGRDIKRMESASPMNSVHTPSPGWNPTMAAPRVSSSSRRDSKLDFRSVSSDGVPTESNGNSRKTSGVHEDYEVNTIKITGRKKFEEVLKFVQMLEQNERYSARNDEDNPFENLTQMTGDISISTWLGQFGLAEDNFVAAFRSMGITTLDDIDNLYTPTLFHLTIGIPQLSAAKLNRIYLNWLNCSRRLD